MASLSKKFTFSLDKKHQNGRIEETNIKFSVILCGYDNNGNVLPNDKILKLENQLINMKYPDSGVKFVRHSADIEVHENSPFNPVLSFILAGYEIPEWKIDKELVQTDGYGRATSLRFIVNCEAHIKEIEMFVWSYYEDIGLRFNNKNEGIEDLYRRNGVYGLI